jgi:hypothetical protein
MMISKRRAKLTGFAAGALILSGAFTLVARAYTNAERAALDQRPVIESIATIRPWGESLSPVAVDAAGIETDLDGNASALYAFDPRQ